MGGVPAEPRGYGHDAREFPKSAAEQCGVFGRRGVWEGGQSGGTRAGGQGGGLREPCVPTVLSCLLFGASRHFMSLDGFLSSQSPGALSLPCFLLRSPLSKHSQLCFSSDARPVIPSGFDKKNLSCLSQEISWLRCPTARTSKE